MGQIGVQMKADQKYNRDILYSKILTGTSVVNFIDCSQCVLYLEISHGPWYFSKKNAKTIVKQ